LPDACAVGARDRISSAMPATAMANTANVVSREIQRTRPSYLTAGPPPAGDAGSRR